MDSPTLVFMARQAILDGRQQTQAYELLHRDGPENVFPRIDPTMATTRVLSLGSSSLPLPAVTGGRPAFVNFTRELLLSDLPTLFPPDQLVIEIHESVDDDELAAACRRLRRLGYRLALDDVAWDDNPLLTQVDLVKVDFLAADAATRRDLVAPLRRRGVRLVAEKLETRASFEEAVRLGYDYFQGFFFSRPTVLRAPALDPDIGACAELLSLIREEELDLDAISEVVKRDVALVSALLRMLNGAAYGWRHRVTSFRHGLALIGDDQVRRWISLLAVAELGVEGPGELVSTSLVRAHMCEALGPVLDDPSTPLDHYLTGMFSVIDVMLRRPLEEVLDALALPVAIRAALEGVPGALGGVLDVVRHYERGDWHRAAALADDLGIEPGLVPAAYGRALSAAGSQQLSA